MTAIPDKLKKFTQHGVHFQEIAKTWSLGTCPFCGKAKHFAANQDTGGFKCHRCGRAGSFGHFLDLRCEQYRAWMTDDVAQVLAKHRSLSVKTLRRWGVGYDPLTRTYVVPMRKGDHVVNVHRYVPDSKETFSTATVSP